MKSCIALLVAATLACTVAVTAPAKPAERPAPGPAGAARGADRASGDDGTPAYVYVLIARIHAPELHAGPFGGDQSSADDPHACGPSGRSAIAFFP